MRHIPFLAQGIDESALAGIGPSDKSHLGIALPDLQRINFSQYMFGREQHLGEFLS
jgi:hypothetical protein